VPQIRALDDIVHSKYSIYLLTYFITMQGSRSDLANERIDLKLLQ